MRGKIRRAELRRPEPGQGLALVAPGEESGFPGPRRGFSTAMKRRRDRLVPLDFAELAGAALADPSSGLVNLAGEYCCMMPEAPLPQITPRLTDGRGLPSIKRMPPSFRWTLMPQRQAHM